MEFTPEAQAHWERLSAEDRDSILAHGFCPRCLEDKPFTLVGGAMKGDELAVIGKCSECGARVVRLVHPPS
jgi:hypothetical protein